MLINNSLEVIDYNDFKERQFLKLNVLKSISINQALVLRGSTDLYCKLLGRLELESAMAMNIQTYNKFIASAAPLKLRLLQTIAPVKYASMVPNSV